MFEVFWLIRQLKLGWTEIGKWSPSPHYRIDCWILPDGSQLSKCANPCFSGICKSTSPKILIVILTNVKINCVFFLRYVNQILAYIFVDMDSMTSVISAKFYS